MSTNQETSDLGEIYFTPQCRIDALMEEGKLGTENTRRVSETCNDELENHVDESSMSAGTRQAHSLSPTESNSCGEDAHSSEEEPCIDSPTSPSGNNEPVGTQRQPKTRRGNRPVARDLYDEDNYTILGPENVGNGNGTIAAEEISSQNKKCAPSRNVKILGLITTLFIFGGVITALGIKLHGRNRFNNS